MKRFSLNKIRKSIWFGIGFGMTAYFMAGCSDNDSSEYIELAARILQQRRRNNASSMDKRR